MVLGVLFEVGAAHAFFERILADAPRDLGRIDLERHLDVAALFPAEKHFYAYEGSLTTRPTARTCSGLCSQKHPNGLHPSRVVRLLVMEGGNARDVQPVNDRTIEDS